MLRQIKDKATSTTVSTTQYPTVIYKSDCHDNAASSFKPPLGAKNVYSTQCYDYNIRNTNENNSGLTVCRILSLTLSLNQCAALTLNLISTLVFTANKTERVNLGIRKEKFIVSVRQKANYLKELQISNLCSHFDRQVHHS